MNKSLAKLLSSAVVLGSVFFSLQTTASPQDWQRIKRPIPATDGKANPNWQLFEWLYYRGGAIAL